MDSMILVGPEVIIFAVLLALVGAAVGLMVGKTLQARRGDETLDVVRKAHARALADAEATLAKQREEQAEELRRLQGHHSRTLDAARERQSAELKRVQEEYAALVSRLNETNNANAKQLREDYETQIAAMNQRQENEIHDVRERMEASLALFKDENIRATEALRAEQQASLESLRAEHAASIAALKREHQALIESKAEDYGRQLEVLRNAKDSEIRKLIEHEVELETANAKLLGESRTLQGTIRELNDGILEAKRNNAFSLSRSGDRLIRVIRSVQELAAELEETSRTVTDGDYSFIGAIKDQRDRDTVLRLAGAGLETELASEAGAAHADATRGAGPTAEPESSRDVAAPGASPPDAAKPEVAEQPEVAADADEPSRLP